MEHLSIMNFESDFSYRDVEASDMQSLQLKTLEIYVSQAEVKRILHGIRNCTSIEKLFIRVWFGETDDEVGDFIRRQKNLKEIHFEGNSTLNGLKSVFTKNFLKNEAIKIEKMAFKCHLPHVPEISDFFRKRAETITELELNHYDIDFHYYRLALSSFVNLKKIRISAEGHINGIRGEEISRFRLPSVVQLDIVDGALDPSILCAIIKIFPNLEVMSLTSLDFSLHEALNMLPKLRKIKSPFFQLETMFMAKSVSIKELDVYLKPVFLSDFWKKLAEGCPNIERLIIKNDNNDQLKKTSDKILDVILKSLKMFEKLEYFDYENQVEWFISNNSDRVIVREKDSFKLVFATNYDGSFKLTISKHILQRQAEGISFLRDNYEISEIFEEM